MIYAVWPMRAVETGLLVNLSWSHLTRVWHRLLLRPKTRGARSNYSARITSKQAFQNTLWRTGGEKPHIIFPHQFLKHPNLEIVAAVTILYLTKAAVYQIFFFFILMKISSRSLGLRRFTTLQTHEDPGERFSSAARWSGSNIPHMIYNDHQVNSVLTQQQMMECESCHTCTITHPSTCVCGHTHSVLARR